MYLNLILTNGNGKVGGLFCCQHPLGGGGEGVGGLGCNCSAQSTAALRQSLFKGQESNKLNTWVEPSCHGSCFLSILQTPHWDYCIKCNTVTILSNSTLVEAAKLMDSCRQGGKNRVLWEPAACVGPGKTITSAVSVSRSGKQTGQNPSGP